MRMTVLLHLVVVVVVLFTRSVTTPKLRLPPPVNCRACVHQQSQLEETKTVGVLLEGKTRLEAGLGDVINSYR